MQKIRDHGFGGGVISTVERADLLPGETVGFRRQDLRHGRQCLDDFRSLGLLCDLFGSGSRCAKHETAEVGF